MKTRMLKFTAGALAAGSSTASAAVIVFDVNPDITQDIFNETGLIPASSINLLNGTFVSAPGSDPAFAIGTNYTVVKFRSRNGSVQAAVEGGYLTPLTLGASVSSSLTFAPSTYQYMSALPTGTFYIGLSLTNGADVNYGWYEITGAVDPRYNSSYPEIFTFKRFAFETTAGKSILAGDTGTPVPEASTFGFVGGLFGLVAAAHLRRRKAKQAAASDKFLALAAGEKLN